MSAATTIIGKSIVRKEGLEKVTGQAKYVDDIKFQNMIHGATIRSTVPRGKLKNIKLKMKVMNYKDIGIELKLSKSPSEYIVNQEISRAAIYSNKYLGGNFKAGDVGKLIYIKKVTKLPITNVILLDENINLDWRFEIDYDKMYKKLILDSINLLKDIKEFRIDDLLNENKKLTDF